MSRPVSRSALVAGLLAALVALPGCISLLPETEPNALYRLQAADIEETRPVSGAETVIIGRIAAPRGLAGDRIALQRDGRIAYMAGAAWLSPGPVMLHAAVMDAVQDGAPVITPARAEDGVAARYVLDLELRHFEAVYDDGANSAPLVQVTLVSRLIDRDTRSLAAAQTLTASARAGGNRQSAIVDGFSRASADVAGQLARWAEAAVCNTDDTPAACDD